MSHYIPENQEQLNEIVQVKVERDCKNFDLVFFLDNIQSYILSNNIKDIVLGVSGGIDSSLVLAALDRIKNRKISDLTIHPVCIKFDSIPLDVSKVQLLADAFPFDYRFLDLSHYFSLLSYDLQVKDISRVMPQSLYALRYHSLFTIPIS